MSQGNYRNNDQRERLIELNEYTAKQSGSKFRISKTVNLYQLIEQLGPNVQLKIVNGRAGTQNEGRQWIKFFESNFEPRSRAESAQNQQAAGQARGGYQAPYSPPAGAHQGPAPDYGPEDRRTYPAGRSRI